jgi:type IV secretory pathway VirB6-like protein
MESSNDDLKTDDLRNIFLRIYQKELEKKQSQLGGGGPKQGDDALYTAIVILIAIILNIQAFTDKVAKEKFKKTVKTSTEKAVNDLSQDDINKAKKIIQDATPSSSDSSSIDPNQVIENAVADGTDLSKVVENLSEVGAALINDDEEPNFGVERVYDESSDMIPSQNPTSSGGSRKKRRQKRKTQNKKKKQRRKRTSRK